jgi:HTH-type transcriptional regulator/antitoxin HipB
MGDVERLIAKWKAEKPDSGQEFERGYDAFRAGVMLQAAREAAGLTQQQVAERMGTQKSAISRLENNAGDVRLSTLQRYAEAVGRRIIIDIAGWEEVEAKPAAVRKPRKSRLVAADTQS